VPFAQVEALVGPNQYLANRSQLPNTPTVTDRSGGGLTSGHATGVAQRFMGIATGVTNIDAYRVDGTIDAGDWLGDVYLRFGTALPPRVEPHRVHNHSWIADAPTGDAEITEIVRRYDLAIRRDNLLAVGGVNNNTGAVPALTAGAYNGIAVGRSDGGSSVGPTVFNEAGGVGAGRSKPDIVAPLGTTSEATPLVAASAVLLVHTANGLPDAGVRSGRAETIKAALLSGATTSEFAGLPTPWARTNNGSHVEPLDRRFGAGELNIDRSHRILTGGEQTGTDLVSDARIGWDFETLSAVGQSRRYLIDAPTAAEATNIDLTATVTWMRRIEQAGTTFTPSLSRFELRLYEADAAGNLLTLVDSSVSPVDNVQHTLTALDPGKRYAIDVSLAFLPTGQPGDDFAVAWFTAFTPVPEPGMVLGVVAVVVAFARKLRRS
jgi:hypothetical protein